MTDTFHATLADLLPAQLPKLKSALKAGFRGERGIPGWSMLTAKTDEGLRDSLSKIDLYKQFAVAFVGLQQLHAHRNDKDETAADTTVGPQRVSFGASPVLSISVNGVGLPPVRFSYDLTASFSGIVLETLRGALVGLRPGECQLAGRLSCGSVDLYKPPPFFKARLPGHIPFSPGFVLSLLHQSPPP